MSNVITDSQKDQIYKFIHGIKKRFVTTDEVDKYINSAIKQLFIEYVYCTEIFDSPQMAIEFHKNYLDGKKIDLIEYYVYKEFMSSMYYNNYHNTIDTYYNTLDFEQLKYINMAIGHYTNINIYNEPFLYKGINNCVYNFVRDIKNVIMFGATRITGLVKYNESNWISSIESLARTCYSLYILPGIAIVVKKPVSEISRNDTIIGYEFKNGDILIEGKE